MKNKLLEDKKVAIIGAGPVGLMTAKLLQNAGVAVTVYERDLHAGIRISGGTLDIHSDTGQKALLKAGLIDDFYRIARPTGSRLVNEKAEILSVEFPTEQQLYNRPEIDRNALRQLLLASLNTNTVCWNKQVLKLEKEVHGHNIYFSDGSTATADLVIGANGGRSVIRKAITAIDPVFTGTFIIQAEVWDAAANVPSFKNLAGEDIVIVLADKKMLYAQPKANKALNYFVCFQADQDFICKHNLDVTNRLSIINYLKNSCKGWDTVFMNLFENTHHFSILPMRKMPLDKKWKTGDGITLVGDAAHLMPPYAGIGVNIGLQDALVLANNLTYGNFHNLEAAIADYEDKMFNYARQAQQDTDAAAYGLFSDNALASFFDGKRT